MRKRIGKNADSIFTPTTQPPAMDVEQELAGEEQPTEPRKPGRPPVHAEQWSKVTVILLNRQIVWLDQLALNIRAKTGASVRRAEIIRALVEAATESGIDFSQVSSEIELKEMLRRQLGTE